MNKKILSKKLAHGLHGTLTDSEKLVGADPHLRRSRITVLEKVMNKKIILSLIVGMFALREAGVNLRDLRTEGCGRSTGELLRDSFTLMEENNDE
ncbi:hypothetical protein KAS08_05590 [Candidatus Pacearchaeota archaeon]|nr:hypothetical protein [Candidatus Pacearchaeota archaeon]